MEAGGALKIMESASCEMLGAEKISEHRESFLDSEHSDGHARAEVPRRGHAGSRVARGLQAARGPAGEAARGALDGRPLLSGGVPDGDRPGDPALRERL